MVTMPTMQARIPKTMLMALLAAEEGDMSGDGVGDFVSRDLNVCKAVGGIMAVDGCEVVTQRVGAD